MNLLDVPAPEGAWKVLVGSDLWFHDPQWEQFQRARAAKVIGMGANPQLVNVQVAVDELLDVQGGRMPPLVNRRNVPVFMAYPQKWPTEPFCVIPSTAIAFIQHDNEAPYPGHGLGGIRPEAVAGFGTVVTPYGTHASEGVAPIFDGGQPPPPKDREPGPETDDDVYPEEATTEPEAPEGEKQDPPEADDPPKEKPFVVNGELDGAMSRLVDSPAWDRTMGPLVGIEAVASSDTVEVHSRDRKVLLLRLTHTAAGGDHGYQLAVRQTPKARTLKTITSGVRDTRAVAKMLRLAALIAGHGVDAKSITDSHQAFEQAWQEAGEAQD